MGGALEDQASVSTPATAVESSGFGDRLREAMRGDLKSILLPALGLVALIVVFSIAADNFFQVSTIYTIARELAIVLVVAVGMTFVILMGSIDLSVGATVTLAGLVAAKTSATYEWTIALGAGLLAGIIIGVVNGLVFAYAKVPSFLATLGTSLAIDGLSQWYTGGRPVQITDPTFTNVAQASLIGDLPNLALWALLIWIVLSVFGSQTRFGRYSYAIGGGEVVSGLSGIPVRRMKFYVMVLCSALAALAGVLLTMRIGAATPAMGTSLTLDSIAAVVIGGTALTGGVGGVHRTILGVLVITVLGVGLDSMVVPPYLQLMIQGSVVILAVALTLDRSKIKILK
jgi:ribose/xylose/arabinose/galactoside ABC-type transport system permease subunit